MVRNDNFWCLIQLSVYIYTDFGHRDMGLACASLPVHDDNYKREFENPLMHGRILKQYGIKNIKI